MLEFFRAVYNLCSCPNEPTISQTPTHIILQIPKKSSKLKMSLNVVYSIEKTDDYMFNISVDNDNQPFVFNFNKTESNNCNNCNNSNKSNIKKTDDIVATDETYSEFYENPINYKFKGIEKLDVSKNSNNSHYQKELESIIINIEPETTKLNLIPVDVKPVSSVPIVKNYF